MAGELDVLNLVSARLMAAHDSFVLTGVICARCLRDFADSCGMGCRAVLDRFARGETYARLGAGNIGGDELPEAALSACAEWMAIL
jgi:hypothetical protein